MHLMAIQASRLSEVQGCNSNPNEGNRDQPGSQWAKIVLCCSQQTITLRLIELTGLLMLDGQPNLGGACEARWR